IHFCYVTISSTFGPQTNNDAALLICCVVKTITYYLNIRFIHKMKKFFLIPVVACAVLAAACGGNQTNDESANTTETTEATTEQQAQAADIPGLADVAVSNEISLEGNDLMQFNETLFRVKAGEPVKLTFKNVGEMPKESMGHNVVILQPGTDLPAFGGEAIKAADAEYIPATFASRSE